MMIWSGCCRNTGRNRNWKENPKEHQAKKERTRCRQWCTVIIIRGSALNDICREAFDADAKSADDTIIAFMCLLPCYLNWGWISNIFILCVGVIPKVNSRTYASIKPVHLLAVYMMLTRIKRMQPNYQSKGREPPFITNHSKWKGTFIDFSSLNHFNFQRYSIGQFTNAVESKTSSMNQNEFQRSNQYEFKRTCGIDRGLRQIMNR